MKGRVYLTNFIELFGDYIAAKLPALKVFGNVDPTREWQGVPTVEFNQNKQTTKTFLSGATLTNYEVTAACRCATDQEAAELASSVKCLLFSFLSMLLNDNRIYSYAFDEKGITADARGLAEGLSFYGFVDFTFNVKGF